MTFRQALLTIIMTTAINIAIYRDTLNAVITTLVVATVCAVFVLRDKRRARCNPHGFPNGRPPR